MKKKVLNFKLIIIMKGSGAIVTQLAMTCSVIGSNLDTLQKIILRKIRNYFSSNWHSLYNKMSVKRKNNQVCYTHFKSRQLEYFVTTIIINNHNAIIQ